MVPQANRSQPVCRSRNLANWLGWLGCPKPKLPFLLCLVVRTIRVRGGLHFGKMFGTRPRTCGDPLYSLSVDDLLDTTYDINDVRPVMTLRPAVVYRNVV